MGGIKKKNMSEAQNFPTPHQSIYEHSLLYDFTINSQNCVKFCNESSILFCILFISETSVQDFMETFRHELPTVQISLKLHFLEDHVIPQICQLRAGLGKLNEQGGESKHGAVNREEKANANLRRQPLKFLTTVVRNVLVSCLPDVLCKMLQRKRRHQEE